MNVLIFSSRSPYSEIEGFSGIGGAEVSLRLIAEKLAERGHNVYFLSKSKRSSKKKRIKKVNTHHYNFIRIPKIHKWLLSIKKINEELILLQMRRKIKKTVIKDDIDIIHCYATYPDAYVAAKVGKELNVPVVQRVAGKYWRYLLERRSKLENKIKYAFNNITYFLPNSVYIQDELKKFLVSNHIMADAKITILDIGTDIEKLSRASKIPPDISEINNNTVICVESFKPYQKRQDILIRALSILSKHNPDIKAIFIGEGKTKEKMISLSRELGVEKFVKFVGKLPHNKVLSLIKAARILVHPTEFEGLSKVIIEAMALSKPIIASEVPAIIEYIADKKNGFLAKNTPQDFADKINLLLKNEILCHNIGKEGKNYAERHFDSNINILKFENLFMQLIKDKKDKLGLKESTL